MLTVNIWHWKSCIRKSGERNCSSSPLKIISILSPFLHSLSTLNGCVIDLPHATSRSCLNAVWEPLKSHWMCWVWAKAMERRAGAGHDANIWEGSWMDVQEMGLLSDQGTQHGGRWLQEVVKGCRSWTNWALPGSVFSPPHTHYVPHETRGGDSELCVYTNRSVTMANHAKPDSHDVTWATWEGINNKSSCS